jgi:uncharacterized protein YijF (DUF1287 family)
MRRPLLAIAGALALCASPARSDEDDPASRVVARARLEVARGVRYDPSYERIAYPGGDVDPSRGVCADVVVRSLRAAGVDLQRLVHEDIVAHPDAHPEVASPDANIDHRRVKSLRAFLDRHAAKLPIDLSSDASRATFHAGDVVVWRFCESCAPRHVAIVSDRIGTRGLPLVIQNLGPVASEDDNLDAWELVAHYRVVR